MTDLDALEPGVQGFLLDLLDPRPGMSVLGIGDGRTAHAVSERVAPGGRVQAARSAREVRGRFDRVYVVGTDSFRSGDPALIAEVASLLEPDGQLWVFDQAAPGESTGPLSMTVSATLARSGFAIVDMLERDRWIAVWAAPVPVARRADHR